MQCKVLRGLALHQVQPLQGVLWVPARTINHHKMLSGRHPNHTIITWVYGIKQTTLEYMLLHIMAKTSKGRGKAERARV